MSIYTECATEKRCLEEISSREGAQLYTEQILNKNTSVLDILRAYPSCKPPITLLLQHLPRLMPRPYSICNSPLCDKNTIKICFSVALIKDGKKGIATGWLEDISKSINLTVINHKDAILENDLNSDKDDKITDLISDKLKYLNINKSENYVLSAYLRNSNTFCLPKDPSIPIIMIAIGTGLAPFIGFLEERQHLRKRDAQMSFGKAWLYFGCRYSDKDFIFKDELEGFVSDDTLSKLIVSHSREDNVKFKYVQVRICIYISLISESQYPNIFITNLNLNSLVFNHQFSNRLTSLQTKIPNAIFLTLHSALSQCKIPSTIVLQPELVLTVNIPIG